MIKIISIVTIIATILIGNISESATIAFGYLENRSGDKNYDYLENIFPDCCSTSIIISGVKVIKPQAINKYLKQNFNTKLKKRYDSYELPELVRMIGSDLFLYGSFNPLPGNRIKIVLSIYFNEYKEIMTITNIGRMETEIFKLVDRITIMVINIIDKFYKTQKILPGSRLAVLTNVDGEDANKIYYAFMKSRYRITCFQGNELSSPLNARTFDKFRYITTEDNSYTAVTDWRKLKFYHGTWTGIEYNKRVHYLKGVYKKYDLNYLDIKNMLIGKLNQSFDNRIDHILIIGFNEEKNNAWLRCINTRKRDLIWIQSNIESDSLAGDRLLNITEKIISFMGRVSMNPLKKESTAKE
jgi:hypothetical protein